jgi:hypothetical protein
MPRRDESNRESDDTARAGGSGGARAKDVRAGREARSAEALRENLKRRKQQARMRMGEGDERHDDEGKGSGGGA